MNQDSEGGQETGERRFAGSADCSTSLGVDKMSSTESFPVSSAGLCDCLSWLGLQNNITDQELKQRTCIY